MNEEQLIELLKKNLRVSTWIDTCGDEMIHTCVWYGDIEICESIQ